MTTTNTTAAAPTAHAGLAIAAFSKTGRRVAATARSAREFAIVATRDGREWISNRRFKGLHCALLATSTLARRAGTPARWDSDVFDLHYTAA